jgi:hypothetical protein
MPRWSTGQFAGQLIAEGAGAGRTRASRLPFWVSRALPMRHGLTRSSRPTVRWPRRLLRTGSRGPAQCGARSGRSSSSLTSRRSATSTTTLFASPLSAVSLRSFRWVAQVVQVGCGHLDSTGCWRFAQWTADALEAGEERRIVDAWLDHMGDVCQAAGVALADGRVCHWSPAEPANLERAYNAARTRHPDADWPPEIPWFDVLQRVIRTEPVTVTGVHSTSA